jgi:ribosomal protein L29
MGTPYDTDIAAWAIEQAALLRAGDLAALDLEHIAEEVEAVSKSERKELESRLAVLIAHLLKWRFQSDRSGHSWESTIRTQRKKIRILLKESPSLRRWFEDAEWVDAVWYDGKRKAERQTTLRLPSHWIWPVEQVLDETFFPD